MARKRFWVILILATVIPLVLCVGLVAAVWFTYFRAQEEFVGLKLNLPFKPTFETTRLTEPVRTDGCVDYFAALNQRNQVGVDKENNFAIPLIQAFGGTMEKRILKEECEDLGIEFPEKGSGSFITLDDYFLELIPLEKLRDRRELNEKISQVFAADYSNPIPADRAKHFANWLIRNESSLDLLVSKSDLSGYYMPRQSRSTLSELALFDVQAINAVAIALLMRANMRIGAKDYDKALEDLIAIDRLATILDRGNFLIERQIAGKVHRSFVNGVECYLSHTPPDQANYKKLLSEVKQTPEIPSLTDALDNDRLIILDLLQNFATGDEKTIRQLVDPRSPAEVEEFKAFHGRIDWEKVLIDVNREFDELLDIAKRKSIPERDLGFQSYVARLQEYRNEVEEMNRNSSSLFRMIEVNKKVDAGELFRKIIVSQMMPNFQKYFDEHLRSEIERDVLLIGIALFSYRKEQGKLPDKLEELVPDYLESLPQDRVTQQSYQYFKNEKRVAIYSQASKNRAIETKSPTANLNPWGVRFQLSAN